MSVVIIDVLLCYYNIPTQPFWPRACPDHYISIDTAVVTGADNTPPTRLITIYIHVL